MTLWMSHFLFNTENVIHYHCLPLPVLTIMMIMATEHNEQIHASTLFLIEPLTMHIERDDNR
jgi:hypothetical protein